MEKMTTVADNSWVVVTLGPKIFNFEEVEFILSFTTFVFGVPSKKSLHNPRLHNPKT